MNNELINIFRTLEKAEKDNNIEVNEDFSMRFWKIAWEIKDMKERILQINRFQDSLTNIYKKRDII